MDYVQLPASGFYFVLGVIVGFIGLFTILIIYSNKQERKNKEKARELFNTLSQSSNEEEKPVKKRKANK